MNNRMIAVIFALSVGALLLAPIVAGDDGSDDTAVGGEIEMEVVHNLGNLTGEIMIQYVLEPSFHADAASSVIVIDRDDDEQ